jgi:hypothetical protein
MIDKTEIQNKIATEEDYIRCPKLDNSLNKFIANPKNSDGVKTETIARLLMMTEEEVERIHQEAIQMLRDDMLEVEDNE